MKQGRADDNRRQCWRCGRPVQEHGLDDSGLLNIGCKCDIGSSSKEQRVNATGDEAGFFRELSYPFGTFVDIWFALYNCCASIDASRYSEPEQALAHAAFSKYGMLHDVYVKSLGYVRRLQSAGCKNSLVAIRLAWDRARSLITWSPSVTIVSLFSCPGFSGAIWDHNDVVGYITERGYSRTVVMRVDGDDFHQAEKELYYKVQRHPFEGVEIKIKEPMLYLGFCRMKRRGKTSIDAGSLKPLLSFEELISRCSSLYTEPKTVLNIINGSEKFDMTRYVTSRMRNSLVFYETVVSRGRVALVEREKDQLTYRLNIEVEGTNVPCQFPEDLMFDPHFQPEYWKNRDCVWLGMIPVGINLSELRYSPVQIIAVCSDHPLNSPRTSDEELPAISRVVDELKVANLWGPEAPGTIEAGRSGVPTQAPQRTFVQLNLSRESEFDSIARRLDKAGLSPHDIFRFDNGGSQLEEKWSRARQATWSYQDATRQFKIKYALIFISMMRGRVNVPEYALQ